MSLLVVKDRTVKTVKYGKQHEGHRIKHSIREYMYARHNQTRMFIVKDINDI